MIIIDINSNEKDQRPRCNNLVYHNYLYTQSDSIRSNLFNISRL